LFIRNKEKQRFRQHHIVPRPDFPLRDRGDDFLRMWLVIK